MPTRRRVRSRLCHAATWNLQFRNVQSAAVNRTRSAQIGSVHMRTKCNVALAVAAILGWMIIACLAALSALERRHETREERATPEILREGRDFSSMSVRLTERLQK